MSQRYEIRFSGAGGQGLILAGVIMAEAASIYDGKQAVQSQSYGPEARGGASKSEVIISDDFIDYPKATVLKLPGGTFLTRSESISRTPPSFRSCEYLLAASWVMASSASHWVTFG